MNKENITSSSKDIILKLKIFAREKEGVRRELVVTAEKLRFKAKQLAVFAKEKESIRGKLAVTARQLALTAEEKEIVRRKLAITAEKLRLKARQLAVVAREKEIVRRKLAITASALKSSYETLEKKVLERTKDLEMARVKEGAILMSIGDGLLATDEKGNTTFINKTAEQLLGKKNEEVVGKAFFKVIPAEDDQGVAIPFKKRPMSIALTTDATVAALPATTAGPTYYYVRKDRTKFPVATMVTPVVLNKKVIGTIEVFRDITHEREIDKAKTEFVSLASHQLRTPLSTVNWYAEMLLAGDVGKMNDKQTKYLNEVYRSNQRMVELVNALLDVSRLELGTFVFEPKPTDIIALTHNVIDEQKPQMENKEILFSFLHDKKVSIIQADPKLLRMVVQNILSNAVKYTPVAGKITVSIALAKKNNVLLKIADTGYGIPKNQQHKIFTKLFRADNVRDKDTDGTGLGLYIAKSIVGNFGGEIRFESPEALPTKRARLPTDNPGTTFFVTLPILGAKKNEGEKASTLL